MNPAPSREAAPRSAEGRTALSVCKGVCTHTGVFANMCNMENTVLLASLPWEALNFLERFCGGGLLRQDKSMRPQMVCIWSELPCRRQVEESLFPQKQGKERREWEDVSQVPKIILRLTIC